MNERTRHWMLRVAGVAASLAGGGIAAMLAAHRSAEPIIGRYSLAALMALVLAGAAAAGAMAIAALPAGRLRRLAAWLADGVHALGRSVPGGTAWHGALIGLLGLAAYLVIASRFNSANSIARDDQADYLWKAVAIRQSGGIGELWRQLWAGTFEAGHPDAANRHPLYLAMLSLRPDFDWAKRLSCVLGLIPLATVWWFVHHRGGWHVAGLAAVLLATNSVFLQSASLVACEMLLIVWTTMAWFVIERCVEGRAARPSVTVEASSPANADHGPANTDGLGAARDAVGSEAACVGNGDRRCAGLCVAIGALLGLAFLTKASALFLLVGFVAMSLFVALVRRWSWLALVSFAIVSSPLLVRNVRLFGDPFYSFNTRFLFADSFDEGVRRESLGWRRDAVHYDRTHSAASVAWRAVSGLAWEAYILVRSLGPATFGAGRPFVGLLILSLALAGMLGSGRRIVAVALVWSAVFYLFFAWYVPIAAGDRFLAPIVPVLITFAARGVAVLAATSNGASKRPLASRIIWMALLWVIVTTVLSFKSAGQNALDWPKRGDYVRWSWRGVWLDRNDPCPELRTLRETNFLCDGTWPRS